MSIQPIETRYKGYRFRSRLEARWAVFFDAISIRWDYEPEGFTFDGIQYLPDFYLPDLGIWCEIKGKLRSTMADDGIIYPELEIAEKFRDNGNAIAVVVGSPGNEFILFYAWDTTDSSGGSTDEANARWGIADDGCPTLFVDHRRDQQFYSNDVMTNCLPRLVMPPHQNDQVLIERAVKTARAARFEFGENK